MAASIIMDMMQRTLVKEGEKEVQDIFRGKRVERIMVGSEVAVVSVYSTRDRAVVVVTLGEVAGLMMIFPVGEGEDLLTMEQINKMDVAIIALVMVNVHKKSCRSVFNILVHFNHPISSNKHPGSYLKFKLKGGRGGGA